MLINHNIINSLSEDAGELKNKKLKGIRMKIEYI